MNITKLFFSLILSLLTLAPSYSLAACKVDDSPSCRPPSEIARSVFEAPSEALLYASMQLKTRTGPHYSATGTFICKLVSSKYPIFPSSYRCVVGVGLIMSLIETDDLPQLKINELVESLMQNKPAAMSIYELKGRFTVRSISTGWNTSASSAFVTLE